MINLTFGQVAINRRLIKRPHTFLYDWFHYHDFDSCVDLTRHQVSQTYLEEHIRYLNWDSVSAFQVLTEEFLIRWNDYIKWDILLQQNKTFLTTSFIDKKEWSPEEWDMIITRYRLSPSRIKEKLQTCPRLICQYQLLNETQIREWIPIFPEEMLLYQQLSPELLIEYKDLFYERDLIQYQKIPISEWNNQMLDNWGSILTNQELEESDIERTLPLWDSQTNWRHVSRHQEEQLSQKFLCKYNEKISWNFISCTQLDEETIELYADKINWKFVSKSNGGRVFSLPFLEKWKDRIRWDLFLANQYTMDQLESIGIVQQEYFTEDVWKLISLYHHLTEEFIERNMDHFERYIENLCKNKFIIGFTESFIDKYILHSKYTCGSFGWRSCVDNVCAHLLPTGRYTKRFIIPLSLLFKHKRILMKEPNSIAASFRINCMIRRCQRSFIERLYHPDSIFIQRKFNNLQLMKRL
jgi:hypothetical protein